MSRQQADTYDDYKIRINAVFQHIDNHLDAPISLRTIASIAYFSPFHFHRVFRRMTGQTLNSYIKRRRLEKAALDILHKSDDMTVIAHRYGFSDNPAFTKAFKKYYGVSPTAFKQQNPNRYTKIRQLKSKNGQGYPGVDEYICIIDQLKKWIEMKAKFEIRVLPETKCLYITCLGSQELGGAFQKLIAWAQPKGLMSDKTKLMTIYHDSLKVTEEEVARLSACIIVDRDIDGEGEIEKKSITEGRFIIGHFEISIEDFEKSWTSMFLWMNENGYKKANGDCFEIYHNNFNEHPEKIAIVDFCVPVL